MLGRDYPFTGRKDVCAKDVRARRCGGHGFVLLCIEGTTSLCHFGGGAARYAGACTRYGHVVVGPGIAPVWTIAEALRYRLTTGFWNKHLGLPRAETGTLAPGAQDEY